MRRPFPIPARSCCAWSRSPAFFFGFRSGLASAVIAIGFFAFHFSRPGEWLRYEPDDLTRLLVVAVAAPAIAVMIGWLRIERDRALKREQGRTAEVSTLRAALNQVDYGVALLDTELRAQFINRAFRRMFRLSDAKAESKPPFVALMYHGRDMRAYAVPDSRLDSYVAERIALVRAGNREPIDIKLANGEAVRFQCMPLPDGGRMLSYMPVTDLISQTEALEKLATIDGLTGAYNRRHFHVLAEAEWSRFRRYQRPLSLLLLDIDHFKSINDCFGHDAGDAVIMDFARVCSDSKRNPDIVGRIGGDEFAILLPETDLADAAIVAERLRVRIEDRVLAIATEPTSITISIGVATATAAMSCFDRLMKEANIALYAAKNGGRNRIAVAPGATGSRPFVEAAE